jgi:hypothetical protein
MSSLQILLLLNILTGRLIFDQEDNSSSKLFFKRSIFTLLLVFFSAKLNDIAIMIVFSSIIIAIDIYWVKDNIRLRYALFMSSLFFLLPGIVNLLDHLNYFIYFDNPVYYPLISTFIKIPIIQGLITKFNFVDVLLIITCYLFTIKESTIIIRGILDSIKAVPKKQQKKDEDEYNRGKYIGILERTFIYFLIIFQQYTAIGILLGLKTFARFKELDKRDFAEYFLIGSMLSILTAALPAIYVLIHI